MTRRGILGMLAASVLDPERLLWKPGKMISIPSDTRPPLTVENLTAALREFLAAYEPLVLDHRPPLDDLDDLSFPFDGVAQRNA